VLKCGQNFGQSQMRPNLPKMARSAGAGTKIWYNHYYIITILWEEIIVTTIMVITVTGAVLYKQKGYRK